MRTTVTLDGDQVNRLMKLVGMKSKARAVAHAVEETLRLRALDRLERLRGTVKIEMRVLRWRHLGR